MLPSPPSTSYSRAYIHPAISVKQKEPGDFPLSSRSTTFTYPSFNYKLSQSASHISYLFLSLFFTITCYFSCKSPPSSFFLDLQSSRMLLSSLPITPATSRNNISASGSQLTAHASAVSQFAAHQRSTPASLQPSTKLQYIQ